MHILYNGMEERLKFGAFRSLQPAGVNRQFAKKRTILFQGEIPNSVMVLQNGLVKVYGITTGGDQRTVTLLSAGDIFPVECAFDKSRVSLYYYEALTDCTVLSLPKTEFIKALEHNDALKSQVFMSYMAHYTSATMHIYALEHSHAQEKLVYILQYLVARFGEKQQNGLTRISLRLSHQDIAEMVGLTRETTAVELHRLKDKKLIDYQRFSYYVNVPLLVQATGSDEFENVAV
ncbi:MAG TPA: Crp/Fnr family transcriptional regulator [Candidatus Saccharimonadales bacterium]|nr:Crp/Fnr family transcriptional regulator [Candidatus Saccharimonadales bacterium]